MAQRRMFSLKVIDTDSFLDMSPTAQLLYFHLAMRADDDGFVASPKKIARMVSPAEDDLKILAAKQFIIPFRSGVIVIRHWKENNYIQNDRKHDTIYKEEMAQLQEDSNGVYSLDTKWIQNGYKMDTEVRLGKDRIGKDRIHTLAGFEAFWNLYPKKTAKKDTERAWEKLSPSEVLQSTILAALEKAKKSEQWTREGGRFIPYPATYLNGKRWEDELQEHQVEHTKVIKI